MARTRSRPGSSGLAAKLDYLSIAGILLAFAAVVGGNLLEGGHTASLVQLTAFVIVFGGTLGAILVQTPLPVFLLALKRLKWVFLPPSQGGQESLKAIVGWSRVVRKDGLLGLQKVADKETEAFTRKGLELLVDGSEPDVIRKILELEIDSAETRGYGAARVYEAMGGYSPTIGIIGAVMLSDSGDSMDRATELEKGVSEDVRSIGEAIDSDDINHLKQAVEGGLSQLTHRVTTYIATEKENFEKTQEKVELLNSKLLRMEDEARDLRGQIKDKQDLAIKDPLTGVYNRFGFDERIDEEFARHERMHSPLSLVFVDCNKFKKINDTFGHKAGDTVLLKVAETLSNRARTSDIVARYGGDEFVVILPDTPIDGAQRFAEDASRIILEAGFNNNGKPLDVSISCTTAIPVAVSTGS